MEDKAIIAATVTYIVIALFVFGTWSVNAFQLSKQDFQEPWRGEIVHTIGLFPLLSVFTVWEE